MRRLVHEMAITITHKMAMITAKLACDAGYWWGHWRRCCCCVEHAWDCFLYKTHESYQANDSLIWVKTMGYAKAEPNLPVWMEPLVACSVASEKNDQSCCLVTHNPTIIQSPIGVSTTNLASSRLGHLRRETRIILLGRARAHTPSVNAPSI